MANANVDRDICQQEMSIRDQIVWVQTQATLSRKEKRKCLKKLRRKQNRREEAEKAREQELARAQKSVERLKEQEEERIEAEREERERLEHQEQERLFQERERRAQEEFERKLAEETLRKEQENERHSQKDDSNLSVEDDGPSEIIWQGNEIIVRKRRVKVSVEEDQALPVKDAKQPTSNPLPPQNVAFASHKLHPPSTPDVAEPNPVFGTEQDKTHCPFHIKTGVCRFGTRCSRAHVYPDHSFTLLVRNMYTGPGLSWDQEEGLEGACMVKLFCFDEYLSELHGSNPYGEGGGLLWRLDYGKVKHLQHTDEEVAEKYEEFYEDVHSEFLQFGELINFKVCENASTHLRGNLYVHFQTEASAQAAYNAMNGRYYAGKQITCEFVGVTRWRVALCGEYMKNYHKPCSHGSACNFLHCYRNPRGEYDWADWDSPPPRYWVLKMEKLFGENPSRRESENNNHENPRRRHEQRSGDRHRDEKLKQNAEGFDDLALPHRRRRSSRREGDSRNVLDDLHESGQLHSRRKSSERHGSVEGSSRCSEDDLDESRKERRSHRREDVRPNDEADDFRGRRRRQGGRNVDSGHDEGDSHVSRHRRHSSSGSSRSSNKRNRSSRDEDLKSTDGEFDRSRQHESSERHKRRHRRSDDGARWSLGNSESDLKVHTNRRSRSLSRE